MNKKLITILLIVILIFQALAISYVANELLCCIVFVLSILSRKKGETFSIYDVFLFTEFFFCFDIIFGDIFGLYDLHSFEHFGQIDTFNDKELITSFKILSFFQAGIVLSWLWNNKHTQVDIKQRVRFSNEGRKLCLILFYIMFIPACAAKAIIVYSAMVYGYVESIQLGELVGSNIYVYLGSALFEVISAFCFYLAVDKDEFKRLALLYAIPSIMLLFTGQRGPGIVTIIAIIWLYNKYVQKVNFKYVAILGVGAVILLPLIGQWRGDSSELVTNSALGWVSHFFFSQGMSFNVIPFTVRYLDTFTNKVPFLFGYLWDLFHPTQAYTIDSIVDGNYLAYHLAYNAYGDTFFLGHTMGTSLIAELYELAQGYYILMLPLSFFIMNFTTYLSNNMYKNPFLFVIGIEYMMCFIYSPRDSIGKVLSFTIIYTIVFTLLMYLLFKKKTAHE